MKLQEREWSCGASVVRNALRCFGIKVSENKVISVAGTVSPSKCAHCRKLRRKNLPPPKRNDEECDVGTDEKGVIRALKSLCPALYVHEYFGNTQDDGWIWLYKNLLLGGVVILSLDLFQHWALAFGVSGDNVIVFDSDKAFKDENGIQLLDKDSLMHRWWVPASSDNLYAILVTQHENPTHI